MCPVTFFPVTVNERQQQRAKNATINRELAALKRMFYLGYKATPPKVLRVPAFPHLAENNARQGFLEGTQYASLFKACPELWFRAIVEVGRTYGWRVSTASAQRALSDQPTEVLSSMTFAEQQHATFAALESQRA
jgi:hypothetical protein